MLSCSSRDSVGDRPRTQVAPDHVAAERQRQPAGPIRPPFAEIDDLPQPFVRVRQLAFVDQQPAATSPACTFS